MTRGGHSDAPLMLREPDRVELWRDQGWQQLWLSLQARPWSSLALVPAGPGATRDFTMMVAVILARTGMTHLGNPIHVADATRVRLDDLVSFTSELRSFTKNQELIVVALSPASENPLTSTLVQATDAALLCVLMGRMATADAKRTVQQIGKTKFLGSAIFRPEQFPPAAGGSGT